MKREPARAEAERIAALRVRETPAMLEQQQRFREKCDREHMMQALDMFGRPRLEVRAAL